MTERKYLTMGSIVEFSGEKSITLDNTALREFVEFLMEHGEKYLQGLSNEEIRAGEKAKDIPRLRIYMFDPNEKAPEFVVKNLAVKVR